MTTDPFDDVYRTGVSVSKDGVRALASRSVLVLTTTAEITGLALPLRLMVAAGRSLYAYDPTDITSAHDGDRVIVSADGRRYRRLITLDAASATDLTTALENLGLSPTVVGFTAPDRVLGSDSTGQAAELTGLDLAGLLDVALGTGTWREGAGSVAISSRVDYLPGNSWAGMIGSRHRVVQMADTSIRVSGEGGSRINGDPAGSSISTTRAIGVPRGVTPAAGKIYFGTGAGWFIDQDDWPWSWGTAGTQGVLGHGNTSSLAAPKRIEWFVTHAFKVGSILPVPPGDDNNCWGVFYLEKGGAGRVAYGGSKSVGAHGDGSAVGGDTTVPVIVGGAAPLTNVVYLHASNNPTTVVAKRADGSWFGWGANSSSCLGISGTNFVSPQALPSMFGWVKAICTEANVIALTGNGGVRICGENTVGQLGVGNTNVLSGWQTPVGLSTGVVDVFGNQCIRAHFAAIVEATPGDRRVRLWGAGGAGQIGAESGSSQTTPFEPAAPFQGAVVDVILAGQSATGQYGASFVRTKTAIYAAGYNDQANLAVGLVGNTGKFLEVLGLRGTISAWAVCGYSAWYGPIVITDRGCYSGGDHSTGAAGVGPSGVNEAVLQPLWVPGIMGPAGAKGDVGPAGAQADLGEFFFALPAALRNEMSGRFPILVADFCRGQYLLNGSPVGLGDVLTVSSGTKWVEGLDGTPSLVPANMPAYDWRTVGGLRGREILIEAVGSTNFMPSSRLDQSFVAAGSTPPVVASGQTVAGWPCAAVAFTAGMSPGWGGSRAQATALGGSAAVSGVMIASEYVRLSRPLVGSEAVDVFWTGTGGSPALSLTAANSSTFVGGWARVTHQYGSLTNAVVYPVVMLSGAVGSDLIVYVSRGQIEAGTVATSWIETAAGQSAARIPDDVRPSAAVRALMTAAGGCTIALRGSVPGYKAAGYDILVGGNATASALTAAYLQGGVPGVYCAADGIVGLGGAASADVGVALATSGSGVRAASKGGAVATRAHPLFDAGTTAIRLGAYPAGGADGISQLRLAELVVWPFVASDAALQAQARVYA